MDNDVMTEYFIATFEISEISTIEREPKWSGNSRSVIRQQKGATRILLRGVLGLVN